jgi:hypothetical protein
VEIDTCESEEDDVCGEIPLAAGPEGARRHVHEYISEHSIYASVHYVFT